MKIVLVILAAIAFAEGLQKDGLRVTWGANPLLAGWTAYFEMPRLVADAIDDKWLLTPTPHAALAGLVTYCEPDTRTICITYDPKGLAGAIQVAFPVEDLTTVYRPEDKFVRWSAPASGNKPAKDYWTITQFLASEETLLAGSRNPQGDTLQDGGVWVTGRDGQPMRISAKEEEIVAETAFTLQNCIPFMGTHYFYNFTSTLDCDELYPWFTLLKDGELIGTGVQVVGKLRNQPKYFENPPTSKLGLSLIVPRAPDCLFDWTGQYGIFTIHIYYVRNPYTIVCL